VIVLHGGPDFDCRYLIPDLDRLADGYRLVCYDQRGRGRSGKGVRPEDVTMASEVRDLETVRQHLHLDRVALLGHSWGTVLALEYALQHPERVSHLILMNPAPASRQDFLALRQERPRRLGADLDRLKAIAASAAYKDGDPDAVAAYYRIHFKPGLKRPEHLDQLMARMRASFAREEILEARKVEAHLMEETWLADRYDLLPRLGSLHIPTLVIYGDHEFIPFGTADHIARAIPRARLVTFRDCGHFSYLECPGAVRQAIDELFRNARAPGREP
jgi:proline iminopeptidase